MAIPVYMFAGFLESGKTSFIASVLLDPGFTRDEKTLIIQCEEGMEEYEPDMLKRPTPSSSASRTKRSTTRPRCAPSCASIIRTASSSS